MQWKQMKAVLGICMIGEGVIGVLRSPQYLRLWKFGPACYQDKMEWLARHDGLMRPLFALEAGLGLWLATREIAEGEPEESTEEAS